MSSNQRPTGVRVISSQGGRGNSGLHSDEPKEAIPAPETGEKVAAAFAAAAAIGKKDGTANGGRSERSYAMLAALFLIGCAIGGAGLAMLGLGARL